MNMTSESSVNAQNLLEIGRELYWNEKIDELKASATETANTLSMPFMTVLLFSLFILFGCVNDDSIDINKEDNRAPYIDPTERYFGENSTPAMSIYAYNNWWPLVVLDTAWRIKRALNFNEWQDEAIIPVTSEWLGNISKIVYLNNWDHLSYSSADTSKVISESDEEVKLVFDLKNCDELNHQEQANFPCDSYVWKTFIPKELD